MATNRKYVRRHHRGALTHTQELELWLGPSHKGSAFASREEMRQAWLSHRDRLMATFARNGKRPAAFWEFETSIARVPGREASALYEANLLEPGERAELETEWRRQFEKSFEPGFFICEGPGKFYSGAIGQRKHYAWVDIPKGLIKLWSAEYRRRSRTVRRIEQAAVTQPAVEGEPTEA
jgi:hypothetical protein